MVKDNRPRWYGKDGAICFTLPPTDGTTGPQWVERLEKKGFFLDGEAKWVLIDGKLRPTSGIIYEIVAVMGSCFTDDERTTNAIRADAVARKLERPNPEVACLIRENFSTEDLAEMGVMGIIVMSTPIKRRLLVAHRHGGQFGSSRLDAFGVRPDGLWFDFYGFASVSSKKQKS